MVVRRYFGRSSLSNNSRNKHFSDDLGSKLGWRVVNLGWEYFDIVVTSGGVVLFRHMDYQNDDRKDYNHSFVYSFHGTVNGREYKVSVIMTTRRHSGSAYDKIKI